MVNGERGSVLRRVAGLVAGVGALGLLLSGVATATIPSSTTGQVAACYRVSGGALRVIDVQKKQRCVAGERLLTWGPSWVWRGAYNPKAAYAPGSVVVVNASSYVARVAVPKGKAPAGNGTSYWGLLASVGAHNHDDRYYTKAETYTKTETDARLAPLTNSVAAFAGGNQNVVLSGPAIVRSVSLMPPANGTVIVTSSAYLDRQVNTLAGVRCSITTGIVIDYDFLQIAELDTGTIFVTVAGTRGFAVTKGSLLTVNLVCDRYAGDPMVKDSALTATFAPM